MLVDFALDSGKTSTDNPHLVTGFVAVVDNSDGDIRLGEPKFETFDLDFGNNREGFAAGIVCRTGLVCHEAEDIGGCLCGDIVLDARLCQSLAVQFFRTVVDNRHESFGFRHAYGVVNALGIVVAIVWYVFIFTHLWNECTILLGYFSPKEKYGLQNYENFVDFATFRQLKIVHKRSFSDVWPTIV